MKKITLLIMSMLLVLCFTACSTTNSGNNSTSKANSNTSSQEQPNADKDSNSKGNKDSKTLVVYYSATGNTEKVANAISNTTNADVFELVPVDEYTSEDLDWTDEDSRVVQEHDNPDNREVSLVDTTVDDWENYDTVFIGYPIWWQIAAWPVDGFVKANDFSGKTVIPFCTSSSSELGDSGKLLADMAGTGNWLEGQRFSSGTSDEEVSNWVENLSINK